MNITIEQSGIQNFFQGIQALQDRIIGSQLDLLGKIAERMADTVANERRIFLFGTGHSHILMEEGFFRAGGLAAVTPIASTALMLHEHPTLGSQMERTPGLAEPLLEHYNPQRNEMMFVFSNSGVNQLPVEMALAAREHGLVVVSVCSLAYARVAPLSAIGKRLFEVSDYALDNGGEPGDGLVPVPGSKWRVGPSSTIINALLWDSLVVGTVYRLQAEGKEIPIFASLNMTGAADHNIQLFEKWRKINPHL